LNTVPFFHRTLGNRVLSRFSGERSQGDFPGDVIDVMGARQEAAEKALQPPPNLQTVEGHRGQTDRPALSSLKTCCVQPVTKSLFAPNGVVSGRSAVWPHQPGNAP